MPISKPGALSKWALSASATVPSVLRVSAGSAQTPSPSPVRTDAAAAERHHTPEAGRHPSIKALARAEGVHHAYVGKLSCLMPLAAG